MPDFTTIARVGDIPDGEGRAFRVHDWMVAVFHAGGQYYAISDFCPHMGASLASGHLQDGIVVCPWHAWRFKVCDGTWCDNPRVKTDAFEVRVVGGRLAEDCLVTMKDYNSLVVAFERTYNQPQRRASLRLLSCLLALVVLFLAYGCTPVEPPPEFPLTVVPTSQAPVSIPLKVGYGFDGGWYQVFFTDPANSFSSQLSGGVDSPLVSTINSARQSVDVATYSLSLNSVRNALFEAHQRGVAVRVVMESENMDRSDPQKLIEAGVPVVGDRREGLMHNKFIVIDRSEVWTGSMNFTDSGAYTDINNLVLMRSTQLAENYTTEFEEMFLTDVYGPQQGVETRNRVVRVNDTKIENFFSPEDGTSRRISELLNSANESIYFLAYSFTNDEGPKSTASPEVSPRRKAG